MGFTLNLNDLRRGFVPRTPLLIPGLEDFLSPLGQRSVSRRTILKMIGAALPAPAAVVSGDGLYKTFLISNEGGRIAFIVGGIERWILDPRQFSGNPQTQLTRNHGRIEVQLQEAYFPGTEIKADLVCRLNNETGNWFMDLKAHFGDFRISCEFLKWLQGATKASGRLNLDGAITTNEGSLSAKLKGSAIGEFHPDWSWLLQGDGIAEFDGVGEQLISDRVLLHLARSADVALRTDATAKRTIIGLDRGARSWNLKPLVKSSAAGDWRLDRLDQLFDRLTIETSERQTGETATAILADAPKRITEAKFFPSSDLVSEDGSPFEVPLQMFGSPRPQPPTELKQLSLPITPPASLVPMVLLTPCRCVPLPRRLLLS